MEGSGSNPSPEKGPHSISQSQPDSPRPKRRILIVEDNRSDVFLMREALQHGKIDADIDVVRDGDAATRYIDSIDANENATCPDLILLDLNLPRKTGDEVLKHLRRSPRCGNVRVLIVSSSDAPQDIGTVQNLSVAGYFKKPSDYSAFMKLGPWLRKLLEL